MNTNNKHIKEPVLAITGCRPDKLPNKYDMMGKENQHLKYRMELAFKRLKPSIILTGFAQGVDTWAAELAIKLKIPFIACIPFSGQEVMWPEVWRKHYKRLLEKAFKIEYVSEPGHANWKFQKRNEYMVDSADMVLAVWDGSFGGTANCVKYAQKVNKPIEYIKF